jgi:hypothetical protein
MSLDIRITQGRSSFLDLAIQGARLDQDVRKAVREMAASYRARVVAELRAPKSGTKYGARTGRAFYRKQRRTAQVFGGRTATYTANVRVNGRTRAYTASAPGQAPAVFTGTLARAVRSKIPARGKGWSARVFADRGTAFYRHMLEFGTKQRQTKRPRRNVGAVAPRPIWSKFQAEIEKALPAAVLAALDRFQRGG